MVPPHATFKRMKSDLVRAIQVPDIGETFEPARDGALVAWVSNGAAGRREQAVALSRAAVRRRICGQSKSAEAR